METGEIFISNKDGVHHIRVKGNASFVCAPPLRELAKKLPAEPFNGIKIDLEECTWMDSTFMGMLAMLGLSARKKSVPAEIFNASEQNEKLLCGLGLNKVFEFKLGEFEAAAGCGWDGFAEQLGELADRGLIVLADDAVAPTERGLSFWNDVAESLVFAS